MIKIKPDPPRPAVTEKLRKAVTEPVTKPASDVTKPNKGGRPKLHGSHADRQRAYRQRKATKAGDANAA